MTTVRHIIDLDPKADARLKALTKLCGEEPARIIADALALLEAAEGDEPDLEEDLRRLEEFERTQEGVPLDEIKAWVRRWGTANELPVSDATPTLSGIFHNIIIVMAAPRDRFAARGQALVAAIHEHPCTTVCMDGRDKPGHDGRDTGSVSRRHPNSPCMYQRGCWVSLP